MKYRALLTNVALAAALTIMTSVGFTVGVGAQLPGEAPNKANWMPDRLADGQPDIQGMWDNTDAMFTPLELPAELLGRDNISEEELQQRAEARAKGRIDGSEWKGHENARGVGGYGIYWFDWFWDDPVASGAPSIIVKPENGRIPPRLKSAQKQIDMNMAKLHNAAENMEAGDRCISRGVVGMMMPTEYNNGTLILQPPGYIVIHSEMIHNARIIPIDGSPHANSKVRLWEGDPRGRWKGNTLIIESTNFRALKNIRGATAGRRSRQTEQQRITERITVVGPDRLHYSITMDDPETYTEQWSAAFPFKRDSDYLQFEYACHEGNYSVPNALGALGGARLEERQLDYREGRSSRRRRRSISVSGRNPFLSVASTDGLHGLHISTMGLA